MTMDHTTVNVTVDTQEKNHCPVLVSVCLCVCLCVCVCVCAYVCMCVCACYTGADLGVAKGPFNLFIYNITITSESLKYSVIDI